MGEKLYMVVVKICRYFIKTAFLWEYALLQGSSLALLCLCASNKIRNFREIVKHGEPFRGVEPSSLWLTNISCASVGLP